MTAQNPTLDRVEDQIAWYDRKSMANQKWFKGLKLVAILTAAVIPFAAGYGAPGFLTGGLGALTCKELKHEKYLWLAKAGPYANIEKPDALLAERVESLISREHAKWVPTASASASKTVQDAGRTD